MMKQMADMSEFQQSHQSDSEGQSQSLSVFNCFRKPIKNKNIRKRTIDEDDSDEVDLKFETAVERNQIRLLKPDNKLHFSTGPPKHLQPAEPHVESKALVFQFDSCKEIQVQHDSKATARLEIENDFLGDARAIEERILKQADGALKGKRKTLGDEKLYKGSHLLILS